MRVGNSLSKAILWTYIKVKDLEKLMGGLGHSFYICALHPWEPPDRGPWEGVCSPRVCHEYDECLKMVAHWNHAGEIVDNLREELREDGVE